MASLLSMRTPIVTGWARMGRFWRWGVWVGSWRRGRVLLYIRLRGVVSWESEGSDVRWVSVEGAGVFGLRKCRRRGAISGWKTNHDTRRDAKFSRTRSDLVYQNRANCTMTDFVCTPAHLVDTQAKEGARTREPSTVGIAWALEHLLGSMYILMHLRQSGLTYLSVT